MNLRLLPILVAGQLLVSSVPVFAGGDLHPLTLAEKRAYDQCLYTSFIVRYCLSHAWGWSDAAFAECVVAQGVKWLPPSLPRWGLGINDACRAMVQAREVISK